MKKKKYFNTGMILIVGFAEKVRLSFTLYTLN